MKTRLSKTLLTVLFALSVIIELQAQTSAFTYQGRLTDNGQPATGGYDLVFSLHDSASGGSQVGLSLTNPAVPVVGKRNTIGLCCSPKLTHLCSHRLSNPRA